ncbi:MAG: helix-turn-helix transcriptional regulator [Bacteroidota bacterium]
MKEIISRLKVFIHHKGLSNNKFADKVNLSSAQISQMLSGNRSFGIDKLLKIFEGFPEINAEWLIKGEGNMLIATNEGELPVIANSQLNLLLSRMEKFDSIKMAKLLSRDDISSQVKEAIDNAYSNATKVKMLYLESLNSEKHFSLPIFKTWEIKGMLDHVNEIYYSYIWLTEFKIQSYIENENNRIDIKMYFKDNHELYSNYKYFAESFEALLGEIYNCLKIFSQYDSHGIVHSFFRKDEIKSE